MSYYDFDEHFWSPREVCCHGITPKTPHSINKFCLCWRISLALVSLGVFLGFSFFGNPQPNSIPQSLYQSQSPTFPRLR